MLKYTLILFCFTLKVSLHIYMPEFTVGAEVACEYIKEFRDEYIYEHLTLINLNKEAQKKLDLNDPIVDNYESKKDEYTMQKISSMTDLKYAEIRYENFPIFEKQPFQEYVLTMLTKGGSVFNRIINLRSCYSRFLNSLPWINNFKSVHSETLNFLTTQNELYEHFKLLEPQNCAQKFNENIVGPYFQNKENIISKAKDLKIQLSKYLRLQYDCTIDPIDEAIKLYPLKNQHIEPFYQNMGSQIGPYFKTLRARLQNIVSTYDSYEKYIGDSRSHTVIINEMNLSNEVDQDFDEAKELLGSTKNLLSSVNGYISGDLLNSLTKNINTLQSQVELIENHNESIKNNEEILTSVSSNIKELAKIIPEVLDELRPVKVTALDFISQIDQDHSQMYQKDFILARVELDKRIDTFLKENNDLLNNRLKLKNETINRLITEIDTKVLEVKSAESKLKEKRTENARNYQQTKLTINKLITKDIPEFEKGLNSDMLNQQINLDDPNRRLNEILAESNALLNRIKSSETQINDQQLSSIVRDIEGAATTLGQLVINNNNFKRLLLSHPTSLLESKGMEVQEIFSVIIDETNNEIDKVYPQIQISRAQINDVKSKIANNQQFLNEISRKSDKIKGDYMAIQRARDELSNKIELPHTEFQALLTGKMKNLNKNVESEVESVNREIAEYQRAVSSIEAGINEIKAKVNDYVSTKEIIMKKTGNIQKVHPSAVKSITNGLQSVENFDIEIYTRLKLHLDQSFEGFLQTLKRKESDQSEDQTYYRNAVRRAENLINAIKEFDANKNLEHLLERELSVDNTFGSFNTLVQTYEKMIRLIKNKLETNRSEHTKLSNEYEDNKNTYQHNLLEIYRLLDTYRSHKDTDLMFTNDLMINRLLENNSEFSRKCELSKSTTGKINAQLNALSAIKETLNGEITNEMQEIENEVKKINELKELHKVYFQKLESLKNAAIKIKEANNLLTKQKEKLSNFQTSVETQNRLQTERIVAKESELNELGNSQTELLRVSENVMSEKFKSYDRAHKELKEKANQLSTDLSSELEDKKTEITVMKTNMSVKFREQTRIISEKVNNGNIHYSKEKAKLQAKFLERKTTSNNYLRGIEDLLAKYSDTATFEDNTMNALHTHLTELVSDIEEFMATNSQELTIQVFSEEIKATIPSDVSLYMRNIDGASVNEEEFARSLEKIKTSHKNDVTLSTDATNDKFVDSDLSNDPTEYSAVVGESRNVASKDYFKVIVAVAAIAIVGLVIGGAILKYKSIQKKRIYNKCENIYLKV